jgi:hypothetical protein
MQKGSELVAGDVVEQKGYDGTFVVTGEWRGYAVVESTTGTSHKAPLGELTLVARQPAVELDERGTLLLVTTAHPSLSQHTLDGAMHPNLGRLIQPRHTSSIEKTAEAGIPWAADNDCFQGLDEAAYVRMLDRITGLAGCLFVTVPDVVGDAEATFDLFDRWAPELEARNLPLALVAQDGLELELDRVEWDRLAAVFIGGTTEWKEGPEAAAIAREAAARGKWVHWGRVNTRRRFDLIVATGAASSFDGSKFARFRNTYLDGGLEWARETATRKETQMPLFRWTLDARADDETDAAIVAEVLVGALRDERNDPSEPVDVSTRRLDAELDGDDEALVDTRIVRALARGPLYLGALELIVGVSSREARQALGRLMRAGRVELAREIGPHTFRLTQGVELEWLDDGGQS